MTQWEDGFGTLAGAVAGVGQYFRANQDFFAGATGPEPLRQGLASCNAVLDEAIAEVFPGLPIIENMLENPAMPDDFISYKCVSGLMPYLKGQNSYGTVIGLVQKGRAAQGLCYFPARNEVYFTLGGKARACETNDQGAYAKDYDAARRILRVTSPRGGETLSVSVAHQYPVAWPDVTTQRGFVTVGMLCDVAAGRFDGALCVDTGFSPHLAGAHAIVSTAGGQLVDKRNRPLEYTEAFAKAAVTAGAPLTVQRLMQLYKTYPPRPVANGHSNGHTLHL